ncbi:MAG TPA: 50S ribosomal protein L17 [Acidobacteriota bacterium]|mgnify:CR=1 FL=1|nr:50S ribosomal protein L17 [Acidobacteriota bacterium]HOT01389.1 50S ribosomal protein L17 [Acidobacteriota bacterium]HQF85729.1 50S ribosomal protein L17 [Acidobacteriota bacterium]HQG91027.1 50S ribosomal protein L17 [Acidobacteriota bacterium]HQK86153.1 50S ribosomal protein L17 [Acidobacteriota bacterium]
MRHRKEGRKLGRTTSHRRALLRNLATDFFQRERIITTLPKAKELRPVVEKLITDGKRGTLHDRRKILAYIQTKEVAHKLFEEIAPRFADRNGGYTRIIKLGYRTGDKAEIALLELLGSEFAAAEKKPAKGKGRTKKTAEPAETKDTKGAKAKEPKETKPRAPRARKPKAEETPES